MLGHTADTLKEAADAADVPEDGMLERIIDYVILTGKMKIGTKTAARKI